MPKRRYRDRHAKGAIGVDLLLVAGFVAVAAADAGGIGQALAMATQEPCDARADQPRLEGLLN